ncbi:MAG: substrate-binding domain-containing protein [Opitutaceae bacterium]
MRRAEDSSGHPAGIPQRLSLVQQTLEILRRDIARGRWTNRLPGERLLCQTLRISRPTLRQALRILQAEGRIESVRGVGHRIVSAGPGTKRKGPADLIVRLLLPDFNNQTLAERDGWIDELKTLLFQSNARLHLHQGSHFLSKDPTRAVRHLVDQNPGNAWILCRCPPAVQSWFASRAVPCLVVGHSEDAIPLPRVFIDEAAAGVDAVNRLARLGHRRIGLIHRPTSDRSHPLVSGFNSAIADSEALSGRVVQVGGNYQDLCRSIGQIRQREPSMTAILIGDARTYATVSTFLIREGSAVPGDISLVSLRHEPFLDSLVPRPSSYAFEPARLGRLIHAAVLGLIDGSPLPAEGLTMGPTYRPGDSIGPRKG